MFLNHGQNNKAKEYDKLQQGRRKLFILLYNPSKTMKQKDDYLWKGILEDVLEDFLRFLHPDADRVFDLSRGIIFHYQLIIGPYRLMPTHLSEVIVLNLHEYFLLRRNHLS